jgi:hypothetical protein
VEAQSYLSDWIEGVVEGVQGMQVDVVMCGNDGHSSYVHETIEQRHRERGMKQKNNKNNFFFSLGRIAEVCVVHIEGLAR